jgi:hypothetical protein
MPAGSGRGSRRRPRRAPDASATSGGRDTCGTSGRSAESTSTTCAVGGTSSRSSADSFSMWSSTLDSSALICSTSGSESSRRARRATWRTCSRSITRPSLGARGAPGGPARAAQAAAERAAGARFGGAEYGASRRSSAIASQPPIGIAAATGARRARRAPRDQAVGQVAVQAGLERERAHEQHHQGRRCRPRSSAPRGRPAAHGAAGGGGRGERERQRCGGDGERRDDGAEGRPARRAEQRLGRPVGLVDAEPAQEEGDEQPEGADEGDRSPSRRRATSMAANLPGPRRGLAVARRRARRVERVAQQAGDRHRPDPSRGPA